MNKAKKVGYQLLGVVKLAGAVVVFMGGAIAFYEADRHHQRAEQEQYMAGVERGLEIAEER